MTLSTQDRVNKFLEDIHLLSNEKHEILVAIRELFFTANTELAENIKYGGLVFEISNTLIGAIFVYKKHISIEFSFGYQFEDPDLLLEGGGKYRRHIKIFKQEDIEDKNCAFYIAQAVRL